LAYAESESPQPATDERRVADRSAAEKAAMFAKRADASVPGAAPSGTGAPRADVARAPRVTAAQPSDTAGASQAAAAAARPPDAADSSQSTATGARNSDAAGAPQSTATGAPQSDAAGGRHPADPKDWLQKIDALRAAGKIGLADAEMRRFRAAFPGYAVKPTPPASSEPPK
jgi:hypothetical protein